MQKNRRHSHISVARLIFFGSLVICAVAQFNRVEAAILSDKRGFADVGANYNNLQATGAGWYYTWGLGDGNPGNFDATHSPMFWGDWAVNTNNINSVRNNPNVEWVLGFNEPERPDQANLSVSQAISSWNTLSSGFSGTDKKLVSPAVSDTADGKAWMSDFMNQANNQGLKVDAVAFHWYGWSNPNNIQQAANNFISSANWYHQWNLPVFVTEFAIHDWGGNYSDAEIQEANRQFLDIVVPWMESTSWIEGYAWYHWFSDAPLYEGSSLKPTEMGHEYIGVVESGETQDIGGQNLGEHVAFLAGGNLTMSGSPGTIRYIRALEGTNNISGSVDWGLNNGSDWLRVDSQAKLRKSGTNRITVSGGDAINNGSIEVTAGILELENNVNVTGSGEWRVMKGGTLQVDGTTHDDFGVVNFPITLDGGQLSTAMTSGLLVDNSSTISGNGSISDDVVLFGNSTLQVGAAGLNIQPGGGTLSLIDDFESYSVATYNGGSTAFASAGGPWQSNIGGGTGLVAIEDDGSTQHLAHGWNSGQRGASRTVTSTDEGESGTYYFKIRTEDGTPDVSYGLSDVASGGSFGFGDFEVQIALLNNGGPTLSARNGGSLEQVVTGLSTNTWYDIWLVIDNETDTYDAYYGTTGDPNDFSSAILFADDFSFRNGSASNDLITFMTLSNNHEDRNAHLDNIYYSSLPPGPSIITQDTELAVLGDLFMVSGTTLALDIYDPNVHDVLDIQGVLTAAGTLLVSRDPNAPGLQPGDSFTLLNFASATGQFDSLALPTLNAGLVWNITDLYSTGELTVVTDVDLDNDGLITGNDLLMIQSSNPTLVPEWQSLYGAQVVAGTNLVAAIASVPEPNSVTILFVSSIAICVRRKRRLAIE